MAGHRHRVGESDSGTQQTASLCGVAWHEDAQVSTMGSFPLVGGGSGGGRALEDRRNGSGRGHVSWRAAGRRAHTWHTCMAAFPSRCVPAVGGVQKRRNGRG